MFRTGLGEDPHARRLPIECVTLLAFAPGLFQLCQHVLSTIRLDFVECQILVWLLHAFFRGQLEPLSAIDPRAR